MTNKNNIGICQFAMFDGDDVIMGIIEASPLAK
jgi:hypothetical protein